MNNTAKTIEEKEATADNENNNSKQAKGKPGPRVISNPNEVAQLVMLQLDAVNAKKDDLTIAIKALADTTKQLTRAYAGQAEIIANMAKRIKELEANITH